MKWSKMEIVRSDDMTVYFDENISFEKAVFPKTCQLKRLHDVTVSGNVHYVDHEDRAYADLEISGVMVVPCSITNEEVEYDFHTKSLEVFAFQKSDDDAHEAKGDVVELLPVIFQLILMEVPFKVVKEDAKYPKGNGWEVVKEEDYQKTKQSKIDPRLAKLKEFKFQED